jgi:hypothetical protein
MANQVIVRVMGGLGNQLFCYAAGRSLSLTRRADLVLDTVSDFRDDRRYQREYVLDHFSIAGRPATPGERLEPFASPRRKICRWLSKHRDFGRSRYVAERQRGWDPRFATLAWQGSLTIDGYWQSYRYFDAVADVIRSDLTLRSGREPSDAGVASSGGFESSIPSHSDGRPVVAVHVRWYHLHDPGSPETLGIEYYRRAIAIMEQRLPNSQYRVFSDDIGLTRQALSFLPAERTVFAAGQAHDRSGVLDFTLMRSCHHFIIANSSFSWWAARLADSPGKHIIAPDPTKLHAASLWRARDLLPPEWLLV